MEKLKLVSSNENKLIEFRRFGLDNIEIEKGRDIDEVQAEPETVILYKAIAAGKNRIVEDTSLVVEGEDVGVNVRWMLKYLRALAGRKATWRVFLGLNDGKFVHLCKADIEGVLVEAEELSGFGFDSIFKPDGSEYTLYELEQKGQKDDFSARKRAVKELLANNTVYSVSIKDVPEWNGLYQ